MNDKVFDCWGEPIDTVMEIAEAAFTDDLDEDLPKAVLREREKALTDTLNRVSAYRERGIRNDLVHTVFEKRLQLIRDAKTVQTLKEIQSQWRPFRHWTRLRAGGRDDLLVACIPAGPSGQRSFE